MPKNALYIAITVLILLGFSARILPHAANMTPITAIALFGALYLPRRLAIAAPFLSMALGDAVIGFYSPAIMASVYASFLAAVFIGLWIKKHTSLATIFTGTMLSSILFFLVTNAAVWAFGTMYAHSFSGLIESYTMAIPFFRNSLLGDLGYTALLVGGMELIYRIHISPRLRPQSETKTVYTY